MASNTTPTPTSTPYEEVEYCPFCDTQKRWDSNLGEVYCPNKRCFE